MVRFFFRQVPKILTTFAFPTGQYASFVAMPLLRVRALPLSCSPCSHSFAALPFFPLAPPLRAACPLHWLMVWDLRASGASSFYFYFDKLLILHTSLQARRSQSHTSPRCWCALSSAQTTHVPLQPLPPQPLQGMQVPRTSLACFVVTRTLRRARLKSSVPPPSSTPCRNSRHGSSPFALPPVTAPPPPRSSAMIRIPTNPAVRAHSPSTIFKTGLRSFTTSSHLPCSLVGPLRVLRT